MTVPTLTPSRSLHSARRRPRRWPWLLGLLAVTIVLRIFTAAPRPLQPYVADPHPVILAHGGAAGHAPTNTLEAFRVALEQGADILELDVHMTKDGIVVVNHDDTIDRLTDGSGYVKDMTLDELRQYDFGYMFTTDGGTTYPFRGQGITIPTLEDVFSTFPGVRVNIEIKQSDPPMEEAVWALVQKYGMEDKVLINSFDGAPVKRWLALTGGRTAIGGSQSHMYEFAAFHLTYLDRLYHPKVDAFQLPTDRNVGPVNIKLDTPRLLATAHRLGIKVHYWTINDKETMRRLLEMGADGIITDYPDRAMEVMQELGLR